MKRIVLLVVVLVIANQLNAQGKYFTKSGKINFDATSPSSPDKVMAVNKAATCVLDTKTGDLQFSLLMRGFEFAKALMMEHFNENYIESSKFPKATFAGKIVNLTAINFSKDGSYAAKVKGKMTIHGETKDVEADGTITIKEGKISLSSLFTVTLADYKISIPSVVADKVAKTAKISISCSLDLLK